MERRVAEGRSGGGGRRAKAVQAEGGCASPLQGYGGQSKGETETETQKVENEAQKTGRPTRGPVQDPEGEEGEEQGGSSEAWRA